MKTPADTEATTFTLESLDDRHLVRYGIVRGDVPDHFSIKHGSEPHSIDGYYDGDDYRISVYVSPPLDSRTSNNDRLEVANCTKAYVRLFLQKEIAAQIIAPLEGHINAEIVGEEFGELIVCFTRKVESLADFETLMTASQSFFKIVDSGAFTAWVEKLVSNLGEDLRNTAEVLHR